MSKFKLMACIIGCFPLIITADNIITQVSSSPYAVAPAASTTALLLRQADTAMARSVINATGLKGSIGENAAGRYFLRQTLQQTGNWHSISPRSGPQGLDHVFIKTNSQGAPTDLLIGESKYNTSRLGMTKDGLQLGTNWSAKRISALGTRYLTVAKSDIGIARLPLAPKHQLSVILQNGKEVFFWRENSQASWKFTGSRSELAQAQKLAEQYGIIAEGKTITVPAGAAGVQIEITVHTMSIAGDVVPSATDPVTTNQVTLHIAGSEVAAETLAATTHQIVPGDALKEIRVDFGDVFSKFPAANREAARNSGQFYVTETNTQTGFLVNYDYQNAAGEYVFSNIQYFKADGSAWTASEDILDLSYMTLNVAGDVAADAKPGDYTLDFVATDADWLAGVYGNELIKVTIPITIEAPKFADMFTKDANWNTAGDTYTARIYANGMAAMLRYADAFEKTAAYADAETSHIGIVFNAIEHNQYPITGWTDEYVTDNTKAVMTYIADGVELDKNVVYNEDGNALEVSELKDMRAYYDVFDGVTASDMNASMTPAEYEAVTQAFTAVSDPFTTQIKTALDGVAINYYINGVAQSNVKLNNDKTITIGSKPSSGKQGLMFELNGDDLFVTSDNFNASAADRLDIFTLYSAFNRGSWAQMNNYDVDVLFEGANGENVTWNANKALQFDITGESSTLNVILKDATGIDYKLTVKVQR